VPLWVGQHLAEAGRVKVKVEEVDKRVYLTRRIAAAIAWQHEADVLLGDIADPIKQARAIVVL
jgi:hypothetical protein